MLSVPEAEEFVIFGLLNSAATQFGLPRPDIAQESRESDPHQFRDRHIVLLSDRQGVVVFLIGDFDLYRVGPVRIHRRPTAAAFVAHHITTTGSGATCSETCRVTGSKAFTSAAIPSTLRGSL